MTAAERFASLTGDEAVRADLKGRSVRAVGFTGMAGVVDLFLRLASTAVLARLLLPEQFGIVMMALAVTAIADQFRDLGLSMATVQKNVITHDETSNLFWINTSAGVLMALVICALSPAVAAYYQDPRLIVIVCVLATTVIFNAVTVQHQALLSRKLRIGSAVTTRVVSSFLSSVLCVVLAIYGYGYWALVWREVSRTAMCAVGLWWCMPWMPGLPARNVSVRGALHFGAHLSVANIIGTVGSSVDRFLLGRFVGAASVGIYRQAYQLLIVPLDQLLSPVYHVMYPGLSHLQTDPARYARFYRQMLLGVCVATMPLTAFVFVYADEIVHVLLGDEWLASAPIFRILSVAGFIRQLSLLAGVVQITRGDSKGYLQFTAVSYVVFIAACVIGVRWGLHGLALATVIVEWALIWPRLRIAIKGSPVTMHTILSAIHRPILASVGMGVALAVVRAYTAGVSPVTALAFGVLTALPAFAAFWLLLPGGMSEARGALVQVSSALRGQEAFPGRADVHPVI